MASPCISPAHSVKVQSSVMASVANKVCLIVIDGWGLSEEVKGKDRCSRTIYQLQAWN